MELSGLLHFLLILTGGGCDETLVRGLSHGQEELSEDGGYVRFLCDPQHQLRGQAWLHCNGTHWSGARPHCRGGHPEDSPDLTQFRTIWIEILVSQTFNLQSCLSQFFLPEWDIKCLSGSDKVGLYNFHFSIFMFLFSFSGESFC